MSRKRRNELAISKAHGWWVYRPRVNIRGSDGQLATRQLAIRLAPIDSDHRSRADVEALAKAEQAKLSVQTRETKKAIVAGTAIRTEIRLGDFVREVYLPFVAKQRKPSTYRGYRNTWHTYLEDVCGSRWLSSVAAGDVMSWLTQIALKHGICKTSLKHIKHFLGGIFPRALATGYLDSMTRVTPVTRAVEIPLFAPEGRETSVYTLEEVAEMLRRLPEPSGTAVCVAAFAGLREGEIRGLNWEDSFQLPVDGEPLGLLRVTRSVWRGKVGTPKTEKSKSPVPMIPQLAERLIVFRKDRGNPASGPIFANSRGNPLDLDALAKRQIRPVLGRAGLHWHGWHGFRRGLATNLNRMGVDDSIIQGILRHSTVAVTQNSYIKVLAPDRVTAMRQFSERVADAFRSPLVLKNGPDADKPILQ